MISLDVKSLFTCIPHHLVYTAIEKRWPEVYIHTELCKSNFLKCVKFCLNSAYFNIDNKFYSQIKGSTMGNSVSPILTELVMYEVESTILS